MMRPVLFRLFCLLFLLAGPVAAQETRIAAVVNDDIVSLADLQERVHLALVSSNIEDSEQNRQRIGPQVLRGLIDEKLEMQEAKRLNVKVGDDEIKKALERIEEQNKLPAGGLDAFLAQRGIAKSTLVDQITATLAWGKLVRRRYGQSIVVTDDEVNEALNQLKQNIGQPLSRVAEIFLAVDDPRQEDEVRRAAERLIEQLRGGASFPSIAQQFSQSATAAVGGDIGWVHASQLMPELAQAIGRMRPGELSPPIRAGAGFYILYVIDRRIPGQAPAPPPSTEGSVNLVQVMFPLGQKASAQEHERAVRAAQAVTQQAKSCDDMKRIGREKAPQTSGDLGKIKITDLPPELREVVIRLDIGQPSAPLPVRGGIGVLMVCARDTPPAPPPKPVAAPTLPSREEIADNLSMQKLESVARRYLRDLRRLAFVDVRV
jgi:peptidyl-prolyl cis-trans isomerase SurA